MATQNEFKRIHLWLSSLGYGNYASLLQENGYDLWEILHDLAKNDLVSIGIKPGHAARMVKELQSIKNNKNQINIRMSPTTPVPPRPVNSILAKQLDKHLSFAGTIRQQVAGTMTHALNGLQCQLIDYNGRSANLINEMNQRIIDIRKINNECGVGNATLNSNHDLYIPMIQNFQIILQDYQNMWMKISEYEEACSKQINNSMMQVQHKINQRNKTKLNNDNIPVHSSQQTALSPQQTAYPQQRPFQNHYTRNNKRVINRHQNNLVRSSEEKSRSNHSTTSKPKNNTSAKFKETKKKTHNKKHKRSYDNKPRDLRNNGRKPAYTKGELKMMKDFLVNKNKEDVKVIDIINLQRNIEKKYNIPRSAYGIAQKMYRMGVILATVPKKLQALQDKSDKEKIKIDMMNTNNAQKKHSQFLYQSHPKKKIKLTDNQLEYSNVNQCIIMDDNNNQGK